MTKKLFNDNGIGNGSAFQDRERGKLEKPGALKVEYRQLRRELKSKAALLRRVNFFGLGMTFLSLKKCI
jgi:hypothetical protein